MKILGYLMLGLFKGAFGTIFVIILLGISLNMCVSVAGADTVFREARLGEQDRSLNVHSAPYVAPEFIANGSTVTGMMRVNTTREHEWPVAEHSHDPEPNQVEFNTLQLELNVNMRKTHKKVFELLMKHEQKIQQLEHAMKCMHSNSCMEIFDANH